MSSRRQKLLARVNWYHQFSLKHITELITGNESYYRGGRYRQVSLYFSCCGWAGYQSAIISSESWCLVRPFFACCEDHVVFSVQLLCPFNTNASMQKATYSSKVLNRKSNKGIRIFIKAHDSTTLRGYLLETRRLDYFHNWFMHIFHIT